jgi:hypothetical protein
MSGESNDAAAAAERIEAALERIARRAAEGKHPDAAPVVPAEIAARIDRLIERLRTALEPKA